MEKQKSQTYIVVGSFTTVFTGLDDRTVQTAEQFSSRLLATIRLYFRVVYRNVVRYMYCL